jgi:hypothetical protein
MGLKSPRDSNVARKLPIDKLGPDRIAGNYRTSFFPQTPSSGVQVSLYSLSYGITDAMPLKVEMGDGTTWKEIVVLTPDKRPAAMADNGPAREVYLFTCSKDDSHSRLLRAEAERGTRHLDLTDPGVINRLDFRIVTTLRRGDSHEVRIIAEDRSKQTLRFSHV